MNLYCTEKLFKRLRCKPEKAPSPNAPMTDWYASDAVLYGEDVIVAVLPKFRFAVLLPDLQRDGWGSLRQQLVQGIRDALQGYPIEPEIIDQYIPADTVFAIRSPGDRKTAVMVNAVQRRAVKLAEDSPDLQALQRQLNDNLVVASDIYGIPSEDLIKKLVHDYGAPVQAMELEVSLQHEGETVRRTLLVPAAASFKLLHLYLQEAFHWDRDHIHCFILPVSDQHPLPVRILDSEAELFVPCDAEEVVQDCDVHLQDYLQVGDTFHYVYNFTENWEHTIRFTKVLPMPKSDLPMCTFLENPAPMERSGAVVNFSDLGRIFAPAGMYPDEGTAELITEQLRFHQETSWKDLT